MSSLPFGSRLQTSALLRPYLRLVGSEAVAPTPDESSKTAVIAYLAANRSGNGEMLRKASASARKSGGQLYAVIVDLPHARFGKAQVRALIDDLILASLLGAKIVRLESSDMVGELLRLAGQCHVCRIYVTRS